MKDENNVLQDGIETEVIWFKTFDDNMKEDAFEFAVKGTWFREICLAWATEDAENVDNDKESYISGKADHYYEKDDYDNYATEDIYEIAKEQNAVVAIKDESI